MKRYVSADTAFKNIENNWNAQVNDCQRKHRRDSRWCERLENSKKEDYRRERNTAETGVRKALHDMRAYWTGPIEMAGLQQMFLNTPCPER
ncbi:MAG: hypothetical protein HYS98_03660 [Deltaproteobacteria bacterium]|nr:hypothetical protein [Deltaproteobacteria bacterium]